MTPINRSLFNFGRNLLLSQSKRSISVTPVNNLKEIIEKKEGKTLTIEAKIVPDPFQQKLFKPAENGACSLCAAGVNVTHTDVLILSQFTRSDGRILPRRITGLCRIQQKRISVMIQMAQRAGLMTLHHKKWRFRKIGPYSFNTYFDETTIKKRYFNAVYRA